MKIGIREDCRHCSAPIALCRVRGGKFWPFDAAMVPLDDKPADAYLPMRQQGGAIGLVPIEDVAPRHLEGIRWVAQRHRCALYLRAKSAELLERQEGRSYVHILADIKPFPSPDWSA